MQFRACNCTCGFSGGGRLFMNNEHNTMKPYDQHTREIDGYSVTVYCHYDPDMGPPWRENDCHGEVRESRFASREDKRPGERRLQCNSQSIYFYDFTGTMKRARKEGWGIHDRDKEELARKLGKTPETLTAGEIREAAVLSDMKYLEGWLLNDWHWKGYVTEITTPDGKCIDGDSCWGYDDEEYMLDEAWGNAEAKVAELVEAAKETELATCWP